MRILVLGGTRFVGRHLVESALADGHDVTIFHRGQSGAELFGDSVKRFVGDRMSGLNQLAGERFDAIVDTCAYRPEEAETAIRELNGCSEHLVFISTISVYDKTKTVTDENSPRLSPLWTANSEITGETYGPLKVACEDVVLRDWKGTPSIIRPGIIIGPYDMTDRYPFWADRLGHPGTVVVPAGNDVPMQVIDARDLGRFALGLAERKMAGIWNAAGDEMSFGAMIRRTHAALGSSADLVVVDGEVLAEAGVQPWVDLPLYVGSVKEDQGLFRVSSAKAKSDGLTFRELEESARDTFSWAKAEHANRACKVGWNRDREAELLNQIRMEKV